jgi:hypothetical protein
LWSFEIPAENYEAFAENMPNLKNLKITLGTRHKINFYAKIFKNLESLSVKFGDANLVVNFNSIFELDTGIFNENLKKLSLCLTGSNLIEEEKFFEMLKTFPNVEFLDITAKFQNDAKFYKTLNENLQKIQEIKLSSISVKLDDEFKPELLKSFKALAKKLNFISILFVNKRKRRDPEVTFEPLTKGLQSFYEFEEGGYSIHCQVNLMEIYKGKRSADIREDK